MTLHLQHVAHLHEVDLFPVSHAHDLVERAQQIECVLDNLALLRTPAHIRDHAREQMESLDVLEDVGRLVGDEENVEVFQGLVDIANVGGLNGSMLRAGWDEFREGREERLYACS